MVTIYTSCLEDHPDRFSQCRSDGVSMAGLRALDFFLFVFNNQKNIHAHLPQLLTHRGKTYNVIVHHMMMLMEMLVPPERDAAAASQDSYSSQSSVPPILGYRFFIFWDAMDVPATMREGAAPIPAQGLWVGWLSLYFLWVSLAKRETRSASSSSNSNSAVQRGGGGGGGVMETIRQLGIDPGRLVDTPQGWITTIEVIRGDLQEVGRDPTVHLEYPMFLGKAPDPALAMSMETHFNGIRYSKAFHPRQVSLSEYRTVVNNVANYTFPFPERVYWYQPHDLLQFWRLQIPKPIELMESTENNFFAMRDDPNANRLIAHNQLLGRFSADKDGRPVVNPEFYQAVRKNLSEEQRPLMFSYENGVQELVISQLGYLTQSFPEVYDPGYYRRANDRDRRLVRERYELWLSDPVMIANKKDDDKQQHFALMNMELMERFAHQCSQMLDVNFQAISPYTRSVMHFVEKFRADHGGSMCFQFCKRSTNLSLWEDYLCQYLDDLDNVYKVATAHFRIVVNYLSVMNQCDSMGSCQMNVLNFGAAKLSKTFSTEIVERQSVDNTVIPLQFETDKSNTSAGNFRGVTKVLNEAPQGSMGFNPERLHTQAARMHANQVNIAATNAMKEGLTSKKRAAKIFWQNPVTGEREEKFLISWRTGTYILNTNSNVYDWDPAMLSRFILQMFLDIQIEGRANIDMAFRRPNPEAAERCDEKYKLIHSHVRMIHEAITHGQMRPMNQTFSAIVLLLILKKAGELGVSNTDDIRKMDMVMAAERVALAIRATLLFFGCNNPANPNGTAPYRFIDTLLTEGHLCSSDISTLVSSLGLLKGLYEDPIRFDVIRGIINRYVTGGSNESGATAATSSDAPSADAAAAANPVPTATATASAPATEGAPSRPAPLTAAGPIAFNHTNSLDDADLAAMNMDEWGEGAVAAAQELNKRIAAASKAAAVPQASTPGPRRILPPSLPSSSSSSSPAPPLPSAPPLPGGTPSIPADELESAEEKNLKRVRNQATSYTSADWEDTGRLWWTKGKRQAKLDALKPWAQDEKNYVTIPLSVRKDKTGDYENHNTIYQLAQQLRGILPTHPTVENLQECITSLFMVTSPVPRKAPNGAPYTDYEKVFFFEGKTLVVRRDLLLDNTRNRLEQAVISVCENFVKEQQFVTFGQDLMSKEHPHKLRVIELNPKTGKDRDEYQIDNQEYITEQSRNFQKFERMMTSLDNNLSLEQPQPDQEVIEVNTSNHTIAVVVPGRQSIPNFEELKQDGQAVSFDEPQKSKVVAKQHRPSAQYSWRDLSGTPRLILNCSLGVGLWIRHMKEIGWSKFMIHKYNAWHETALKKQLIQNYDIERKIRIERGKPAYPPLKAYPDNMGFMDRASLKAQIESDLQDPLKREQYLFRNYVQHWAKSLGFEEDLDTLNNGQVVPQAAQVQDKMILARVDFFDKKERERKSEIELVQQQQRQHQGGAGESLPPSSSSSGQDSSSSSPPRSHMGPKRKAPPLPPGPSSSSSSLQSDEEDAGVVSEEDERASTADSTITTPQSISASPTRRPQGASPSPLQLPRRIVAPPPEKRQRPMAAPAERADASKRFSLRPAAVGRRQQQQPSGSSRVSASTGEEFHPTSPPPPPGPEEDDQMEYDQF